MKELQSIYDEIAEKATNEVCYTNEWVGDWWMDLRFEAGGKHPTLGLVVGTFEGIADIKNYHYYPATWEQPEECIFDINYKGTFSFMDAEEIEHTEEINEWVHCE